ncbi:MAG TPA: ketopantoate reductase C-terminal domain-containing protein, partial [Stellaceae bacterium]
LTACTGLTSSDVVKSDALRRFAIRHGSEAIRVGQAQGYHLEEVYHLPPELLARADEGDGSARETIEAGLIAGQKNVSAEQRPSMAQDMIKGRRTEIDFLNGFIVGKGAETGIGTPANAALTEIVGKVERGALRPDPRHITDLRLN